MFKSFYVIPCILFLALLSLTSTAFAQGGKANGNYCEITSGGQNYTINDAWINITKNESFTFYTVERIDKKTLFEEILLLSIAEVEPGLAQVSGLTTNGINSRWGEARLEGKCWVGSDFKICLPQK